MGQTVSPSTVMGEATVRLRSKVRSKIASHPVPAQSPIVAPQVAMKSKLGLVK